LRTAEFLWQEGHTAHATKQEAIEETERMVQVYAKFAREYMSMPVIVGSKTESERFAGALDTLCIEALMQDGKALQAGTSHFLGQNFAKAFDVQYQSKEGSLEYVWATSWGVSTRLMGALIMAHSDNNGLVLPPKLAPIHVVMVPIFKTEEECEKILAKMKEIKAGLDKLGISSKIDERDHLRSGFKFAEWELKGVPVRIAIGPRDLENGTVELARRDTLTKSSLQREGVEAYIQTLLDEIQENIYNKALKFREENTFEVNDWDTFKTKIEGGGFLMCHWDGTAETEEKIKAETKATIRCIPLENVKEEEGFCVYSGKPSKRRVIFARAY
jgi:prolyl-tRNA synthetase